MEVAARHIIIGCCTCRKKIDKVRMASMVANLFEKYLLCTHLFIAELPCRCDDITGCQCLPQHAASTLHHPSILHHSVQTSITHARMKATDGAITMMMIMSSFDFSDPLLIIDGEWRSKTLKKYFNSFNLYK